MYWPPSADQSESQLDRESVVQNDHSTQMNQNVAKVFNVTMPTLRQVWPDLPRLRCRPYLISYSELATTTSPRITQNNTSCQTRSAVPRSQNHW